MLGPVAVAYFHIPVLKNEMKISVCINTEGLAFLLMAQEILSARGQLQTHRTDRIVELAHYPKHRYRPHQTL